MLLLIIIQNTVPSNQLSSPTVSFPFCFGLLSSKPIIMLLSLENLFIVSQRTLRVNISLRNPQFLPTPCLNWNLVAQPSPQPTQEPMLILPHIPSLGIGIGLFLIPQCCCPDLSLPPSGKTLCSVTDQASLILHHYWLPASIHTSPINQTHWQTTQTFYLLSAIILSDFNIHLDSPLIPLSF